MSMGSEFGPSSSNVPPVFGSDAAVADTRTKLTRAAAAEFVEHGFSGTDTNRIARRAGFAPQTFYRWFKDKVHVFIQVYQAWEDAETVLLESLLTHPGPSAHAAEACVESYRSFLLFRRNLRQLVIDNAEVRAARAASRWRQVRHVRRWNPALAVDDEQIAAWLIQLDLLCLALADGEWSDMGLQGGRALHTLAGVIEQMRLRPAR